jgi:cyclic pyranopterin phosphate synthase
MTVRALPVLTDTLARRVTYLRVSLTDRCNYRCVYCMPEEGVELVPKADVLTFEELERVIRVFAGLGVRRVRLTGGEPTVRKDVVACVERLAAVPGIEQVVMTTNGHLLEALARPLRDAGLYGLNVSVDSLDRDRFHAITRRGDLDRVLAGIEAARALGFPVKLNAVGLKGVNDHEVGALCDWSWARGVVPRFIEQMPLSDGALFSIGGLLTAAEIRGLVQAHTGAALTAEAAGDATVGPARYWRLPDGRRVGIISALSENFCATCNLLRGGADVDDDALAAAVRAAVGIKRAGHEFTTDGCGGPRKHMVSIGG